MTPTQNTFNEVSLLITHYNRSSSLERLLSTFDKQNIQFKEIIVSDDSSNADHLDHIASLHSKFNFTLLTTPVNKGLGNNMNKGQLAVRTPYTLYVQEDFIPADDFVTHFNNALKAMNDDLEMDIIRFYAYIKYPYRKPFKNGFSLMYLPTFGLNYKKIYQYSDHPHLRRSTFLTKFGYYAEGIKGDRTEYQMCISFLQNKGKGLFYNDFTKLFIQENSELEPSTMKRGGWKESENIFVKLIRDLYRQIKYNYDIHFMKLKK